MGTIVQVYLCTQHFHNVDINRVMHCTPVVLFFSSSSSQPIASRVFMCVHIYTSIYIFSFFYKKIQWCMISLLLDFHSFPFLVFLSYFLFPLLTNSECTRIKDVRGKTRRKWRKEKKRKVFFRKNKFWDGGAQKIVHYTKDFVCVQVYIKKVK